MPRRVPSTIMPRGLRIADAARYVGISTSYFQRQVDAGILPSPRRLDNVKIWDRRDLDQTLDDLPYDGQDETAHNPWDD